MGQHQIQSRDERREHHRAALNAPALLDLASSWQRARCHDVSLGGMRLETSAPPPIGQELEIYFELPTRVAVEARARVVRQDSGGVAIRFLDLADVAHLALEAFCESTERAVCVSGVRRLNLAVPRSVRFGRVG